MSIEEQRRKLHYPTDRAFATTKRTTDVMTTKWPVITQAAYQEMLRRDAKLDPAVNQLAQRLSMSRIRLGQALLAMQSAMKECAPQQQDLSKRNRPIYNRLRSLHEHLEKDFIRFPLEIMNK